MSPATTAQPRPVMSGETPAHAALRHTRNLAQIVGRATRGHLNGRNRDATIEAVERHFESALRAVLALEDRDGIDATAMLSDGLTKVRQRAMDARLLTPESLADIEQRVIDSTPMPTPLEIALHKGGATRARRFPGVHQRLQDRDVNPGPDRKLNQQDRIDLLRLDGRANSVTEARAVLATLTDDSTFHS